MITIAPALFSLFYSASCSKSTGESPLTAPGLVHCYESLKTLSSDAPANANCFEISESGLFSRVFKENRQHEGHVYPGLWDGHGHLLQYGELLQSVNLFGSEDLKDALERVKEYAHLNPKSGSELEWMRGTGWDQAAFGRMPTAVSDFDSSSTMFKTSSSSRAGKTA